jgi:probable rRNA maturation factor
MIGINNLTTNSVDEELLKRGVQEVLKRERIKKKVELSIALVGSSRMRKLNRKYRGKNRVTDVLAFSETEMAFEKFETGPFKQKKQLGEIVICLREVKKNSKRLESSFEKELARVLIHGLLHLLGYDHEKNEQETKKMREKEEFYLEKIRFV